MKDIILEEHDGLFWVSGGPIMPEESFDTREKAYRFARRQAGTVYNIILKGATE